MKFEEFLLEVERVAGYDFDSGVRHTYASEKHGSKDVPPRLFVEWSTGGTTGASCWGGSSDSFVEGDAPEELKSLGKILERLCPSMTFIQYMNLSNELIKTNTRGSSDYYGNTSHYASKTVDLRELFDYLKERNFLQ